ncbi:MAG: hypothetical protein IKJ19_08025 [Clostridia bacterium]|nr:hypothetical protein [Clostridia bacterium]
MDINKCYQILGCDANLSDDELYEAYKTLRTKYQNDRFLSGEEGNIAAKKLTELNDAYLFVVEYRKDHLENTDRSQAFLRIDSFIKAGKINEAQIELDKFDERNAEWHYLQSVVFYRKNWINESKKQLEIAMQMDDNNEKYKNAYDKLCKQINFNEQAKNKASQNNENWNKSGNANFSDGGSYQEPDDMMGGDACADYCCRLAICNLLLNCCCNCQ